MPRQKSKILTDTETNIMDILWSKKEASVQEVSEILGSAYTTVATMLGVLEKKGYIKHRTDKRTYLYSPLREKKDEQQNILQYIKQRFFEGSTKSLFAHLIKADNLNEEQLEELKNIIDEEKSNK